MTVHAPACLTARSNRRLFGVASRIGVAPLVLLFAILMPLPVQGGKSLLGLPSLCAFYTMTGLPCPGCGITRSVVCCCHLRFVEGFTYHPLGPIVTAWLLLAVLQRFFPVSWRERLPTASPRLRAAGGITLALSLFAVWGARLAGWLPSPP